jgi:phosphopantothenoylcysteine decarboxylase/phosphopantothenate--cysteine ligase
MPEPETIVAHAARTLDGRTGKLMGRTVLVTAGPTREAIDPVRFLTNHSSGRMGVALAEAAWRRGATVTLVAGSISVDPPVGARVVRVESTVDMRDAVARELPDTDLLIMAAAPADYRPATVAANKLKKTGTSRSLELEENPDILVSTRSARRSRTVVVGFALETEDLLQNARRKLLAKEMDLIVLNDATEPGAGFGVETNRVTILSRNGGDHEALPLLAKSDVADAILDRAEALLDGR